MVENGHVFPVMGIPLFTGTMDEARDAVMGKIASGEPLPMMTVAVWTLIHARDNPAFLEALRRCPVVLPDGWPVVMLVKMAGRPIHGRLAGADFVYVAARWCRENKRRLVLYGSADGIAQQAAERLKEREPGLDAVGITPPFKETFTDADADAIAGDLKTQNPAAVIVGIAVPKGELLLDKLAQRMPGVLILGVGGALDNTAGWRKRAPALVQKLYIEWIWRTLQNPKEKVPRVVENFAKWPGLWAQLLREARRAKKA
jgi:N-acetylglucosaminyldiphosphoundecaprenol N-acetyl-beta-D-mannosaminyltransferase